MIAAIGAGIVAAIAVQIWWIWTLDRHR